MKKFLTILLVVFLYTININVQAASLCTYEEQTTLNQKAANVKVSYEIIEETLSTDEGFSEEIYFNVTILNITEDLEVVVKNNLNEEEVVYTVDNTTDGAVTFKWSNISSVTNFTIEAYSSDETSCPGEKYKTIYLTTPRYNSFYNREVCNELEDFYLCEKFVTFAEVDDTKFFDQVESFRNEEIDESGEQKDDTSKEKVTDKIFDFIEDYKWFIIGGLVVILGVIIVIERRRTKKQRDLGL